MTRSDFQQLAQLRIEEATVLLAAGKFAGAFYLGGYTVECALKACIAKLTKEFDFPDKKQVDKSWTHNLETLVLVSGLAQQREADVKHDLDLATNWLKVKDWDETTRYEIKDQRAAQELYDAITDPKHGVLPWIQQYW